MTTMKLLKLVYISHGWFLGYNDRSLISDAVFAWKYGPVIISVYECFRKYGKNTISGLVDIDGDGRISENEFPDQDTQKFLAPIWDNYKNYSAIQLSSLTHQKGSPWDIAIKTNGVNSLIPNELIRDYYKEMTQSVA